MKKQNFIIVCKNIREVKMALKAISNDYSSCIESLLKDGVVYLAFYYDFENVYYGGMVHKEDLWRYEQYYKMLNAKDLMKPKFIEVNERTIEETSTNC